MLVDTSVWIDHFRSTNRELAANLENAAVWSHPFVIGELACGSLSRRSEVLAALKSLPQAPVLEDDEVLLFVDREGLQSRGLGWIDVHLLASARMAGVRLWTRDKRLAARAGELGLDVSG